MTNKQVKKQPAIFRIKRADYSMINVTKENGELIASITSDRVIVKKGYHVDFVEDADKVRFQAIED